MKVKSEFKIQIRDQFQPQNWDEGTINLEPSRVQPEHAEELETNAIMERYALGLTVPLNKIAPMFADLTQVGDFAAMQDKVLKARELFVQLPIPVKDTFRTAESFLEAFNTPDGHKKLEALGVLEKKPVNPPVAGSGVQPQEAPEGAPAS